MKHVVLALFLLGLPPSLLAQSSRQNYVLTKTLLNASGSNKVTEVQYHDGLGRPEIHVTTGLGVSGNSAYTLTEYDELGRGHIHWLPGIGGKGVWWKTTEKIKGLSRRSNGDENCYSEATYDPLGRERSVLGPGEAWKSAGKPQQTQRVANLSAGKPDLVVKRYVLGQDGQPEERGAWKSGALMGERHVDEDGKSVTVFTNLMGEKVLERQVISAGVFADTYYVYDDLGQLRFVLPPMCDLGAGKQQALEAYAYEYRYDGRSRVVYKRLPGCAPVRYWYDNRGRVVFTQDGELLKRGLCRFTFYDPHGRLAMQGTCTDTPHNVHSGVVTLTSVDGLFHSGYVGGVHLASPKVERINYYDDYNFLDGPSFKEYTNVNLMRKKNAQNATGHPTGSVTLTTGGERLYGVTYYTAKGLPCDTRQSCLGGKVLLSRTEYSFTDKPLRTVWEVRHDGRTDSVVYANSYSPVNDALAIQLVACNGGAPQFVSRLKYDDLGRLVRKTLPGNSGSVEYGHNVRGWLTTLSGPGYAETLSYDGLYNGNIVSVSHSYQNGGVRDTFRYTFAYDNLNRMVSAGNDHYGESVDYDRNGNVVALHRYGKRNNGSYGLTDDLQLHYVGNHIRGITDRQGGLVYEGGFDFKPKTVDRHRPYEYNTVGALAHDPDRNVTVSYSVLGTPAMIAYGNGNTTEYIYDADGTKLKTTWKTRAANALCSMVAAEETGAEAKTDDGILSIQASVPSACVENSREQVGPFVFTDGKLERVLFDGGFCLLSGQYAAYCYYVCDHLGSVREVVSDAWNVQRNGYYAYGGPYGDWNTNADVQPLKFLGKEWDHQHGLDLYDFGARLYDPAVGRWTTMDPLCEKYYSVSPYAYCFNNPVKFIDPDGKKVLIFYQDKRGNLTYFVFNGTQRRLPNNSFVLDFVHTYNYLKANGVGKNVIKAVKDPSVMVELVRDEQETGYYFNYKDRNPAVFWESRKGIILSNGKRQSPAVRLEHEFDHALDDIHDHKKHEDRRDTQNAQYDNEEERRVIEGSEAETARKLRQGVRFDHWGKTYPVKDPRFTK